MPEPFDAGGLRAAYADGRLSPVEVAELSLRRAGELADRLNAIASTDRDGAMIAAEASARRWRDGSPIGPLDGVPITFKDSFHVAGLPRWHGTAVNPGALSPHDSAPVRRAREAGMLVVAKTTMPDFAMLMSGLSSQHGVIRNAWDPSHNTGGSSAGAGPSVAAGAGAVALGTDMVGSVRIPAALSGLASLKPTQGRIAYDPAGDYRSAGPMARTVADVRDTLAAIGRHDPVDHFALPGSFEPSARSRQELGPSARPRQGLGPSARPRQGLAGVTVGVLRRVSVGHPVDQETAAAVDSQAVVLRELGATVTEIDDLDLAQEDQDAVTAFMISHGLPDYLARSPRERGAILPEVGAMFDGALTSSAVEAALGIRRIAVATERISTRLAPFDYVLSPVLPVHAFAAEALSPGGFDPVDHMGFACWFNRTAAPAGTVPVLDLGAGRCPVSVQIAGRRFDDAGVLDVLELLERHRGFDITWPEVP